MSDINNTNDAVRVLWQRFDVIDGARQAVDSANANVDSQTLHNMARDHKDGRVSEDDLRAVVGNEGFTDEERAAAQYLLDHPDVLDSIDGADTGGNVDDNIGRQAVVDFIDANRSNLSYDMVAVADASRILGVGERGGQDDYDARLLTLTQAMGNFSPEDGQLLINEVLRQDPEAQDSWLQLDRLDGLRPGCYQGIYPASFDAVETALLSTPQGIDQFISGTLTDHVNDYQDNASELNWRIANYGSTMTPEQLQTAIREFKEGQGDEWNAALIESQGQVAADGESLLRLLGSERVLSLSADQRQAILDQIIDPDNPQSVTAILQALSQEGGVDTQTLDAAMTFFAGVDLRSASPELSEALGQARLMTVNEALSNVDASDPASITNAREQILALQGSSYAALMGLTGPQTADFNAMINALATTVDTSGLSVAQIQQNAENLAAAADQFEASLGGGAPNPIVENFRALGAQGTLISLDHVPGGAGSEVQGQLEQMFGDIPTSIETVAGWVDLAASTTDVLVDAGRLAPGSLLNDTLGNNKFGGALAVIGLGFGIASFAESFEGRGVKVPELILSSAGIVGSGFSIASLIPSLASTTWLGPAGWLIGGAVLVGGIVLNQARKTEASNEFADDASQAFLEQAGFDPDVANALTDQSGEGYSPVPFLFEYAASRGLDREQTIAWLNDLDADDLESIRDRAHEVLDSIDGDLSKLDGDSDPEVLEFLSGYSEAEDRGGVYTHDQGNDFTIGREYRQIVAGTWEEFSAVLSAKDRPLPTV